MARVLLFGRLRDLAGAAELELPSLAQMRTIADARAWLAARDPLLGAALAAPGVRVAVDRHFADDSAGIAEASEIAFMSPLSGG